MPIILPTCKMEEGGDAVASLTDGNAADGKTGGAESVSAGRMELRRLQEINPRICPAAENMPLSQKGDFQLFSFRYS